MAISFQRRLRLYERDGFRCQECGFQTTRERVVELTEAARLNSGRIPRAELLTLDHVIPRSAGGKDDDENLATLCAPCNNAKGDRVPSGVTPRQKTRARRLDTRIVRGALVTRVKAEGFSSVAARVHRPGCDPVLGCVGGCPVGSLSGYPFCP